MPFSSKPGEEGLDSEVVVVAAWDGAKGVQMFFESPSPTFLLLEFKAFIRTTAENFPRLT